MKCLSAIPVVGKRLQLKLEVEYSHHPYRKICVSESFSSFRELIITCSGFGGLEVACWPLLPKFAGSNPAEAVGFFGRNGPQHAFFRRGIKPSVACHALRHVKEPKCEVEVATFGKISRPFLAHSSTFRCWVRQRHFRRWGPLVAKVGVLNRQNIRAGFIYLTKQAMWQPR
jgi:hypothetical protein